MLKRDRTGVLMVMKQQRYHLRYGTYVEKSTHLYGIPSGKHKVYGECTCDKMADLMFHGKQKTLQLSIVHSRVHLAGSKFAITPGKKVGF